MSEIVTTSSFLESLSPVQFAIVFTIVLVAVIFTSLGFEDSANLIAWLLDFVAPNRGEYFGRFFNKSCVISADILLKTRNSDDELIPEIKECDPEVAEFNRIRNSKLF